MRHTAVAEQRVRVVVDGRHLTLSNLDKVLYPRAGFTKGEVIDYYSRISPYLLPHLEGRALTRIRYPDGVGRSGFFEKNVPNAMPAWVRHRELPAPGSSSGRDLVDYVIADGLPTLVWLANLAALELHVPQWRLDSDGPDRLVIDLDPGPPAGLPECAAVALMVRERLAADGLTGYPKSSGKKGMQLMCAISATQPAEQVSAYARRVAEDLARAAPDQVVSRMARQLRTGRVFIDWSQNNAAKTTVAPYSLRAEPIPSVSTPLNWAEVEGGTLGPFQPAEVLARVDRYGDLMAGLEEAGPAVPLG